MDILLQTIVALIQSPHMESLKHINSILKLETMRLEITCTSKILYQTITMVKAAMICWVLGLNSQMLYTVTSTQVLDQPYMI
ncbi:hypothetical protein CHINAEXTREME_00445 [Halobiforma lacisalsi AJ5]|uniref:Uncharacterized protein n=1 Tax=Natronobacterium lacisalsi AJ5 TaxID=358396 RepID=M0L1I2_NATLA|nr:hypothetical protein CHINAEXTREME_00445 [Halobiforma lacisalsi AJ5]EMA27406.1 hypothetical protein C445_20540 [Halobiforma lacisalsi AJ5]